MVISDCWREQSVSSRWKGFIKCAFPSYMSCIMEDQAFKAHINRAKYIEYQICKWYRENVDPKTRMALPKTREYDIICPAVGNIEVKEDQMASHTHMYALEVEDQSGQPSGIAATTAKEFVIVDDTSVLRMKTTSLSFLVEECKQKKMIQMGYTTKEGKRAWGYLVPVSYIQASPYVEIMERWFT